MCARLIQFSFLFFLSPFFAFKLELNEKNEKSESSSCCPF